MSDDDSIMRTSPDEPALPFAFLKCEDVTKNGTSSYKATCGICGKKVNTTPHKMMYGHYLHKPNQNMATVCVAISILHRDNPAFVAYVSGQSARRRGFVQAEILKRRSAGA
ncbi:hypothetical protein AB1Y20_005254 [Prymnesium parvum]|uniref:Uncharacterized protein n=1 Tax=Prymnesium parvum TaxID=97485 RepID=A0AB34J4U9_PRYPA